jgi:lactate permease
VPQFLVSNLHGPWLVDIISGACSILALVGLLRVWRPKDSYRGTACSAEAPPIEEESTAPEGTSVPGTELSACADPDAALTRRPILQAWAPWLILTAFILVWGLPQIKSALDQIASPKLPVRYLHHQVQRIPPVAPADAKPEPAEFRLNVLSATGTGILFAAITAGIVMGFRPREMAKVYLATIWRIRFSLLTIAAMLALGNVTKYSGADATLGLALAATGPLYPFFGTLLGWLGVALTGSDTASNVLFGSLQKITAEQTGFSPILMAAANSSGGVMGKMVDAQSIVVGSTATNWYGHEGSILRFVFFHSLVLAILMGLLVLLQAYVMPFKLMVP